MRLALWSDAEPEELEAEVADHFAAANPGVCVFICENQAGQPAGMLELDLRSIAEGCTGSPVPYVEAWYVAPEMRRRGIGAALMRAARAWALENGYRELASDTQLSNEDSARAHRALGFEEVERAIHFRLALD
jgi:aminoglycoside 6'-N-acetyltransferase I